MKREQLLGIYTIKYFFKLYNDKKMFENTSNLNNICIFTVKYSYLF